MNESTVPDYAKHNDKEIKGFFGEYRWLSNFWPAPVMYAGNLYKSVEHAFVAAKNVEGLIIPEEIEKINNMSAGEVKRYGKTIVLRQDWGTVRYQIMAALVFDKFFRNDGFEGMKNLKQKLLETGDKYLEETNNWGDMYWGVAGGVGQNNLGKILMKVREFWK